MEKPRGVRLLHQLLVLYQRVALYNLSGMATLKQRNAPPSGHSISSNRLRQSIQHSITERYRTQFPDPGLG